MGGRVVKRTACRLCSDAVSARLFQIFLLFLRFTRRKSVAPRDSRFSNIRFVFHKMGSAYESDKTCINYINEQKT